MDTDETTQERSSKKWLLLLLVLALVAVGSYAYATNLGGVRDALVTARETAEVAVDGAVEIVKPSTVPDPRVHDLSRRIADLELRSAVRDAIERHPELAAAKVRVQALNGNVTLSGAVDTAGQREVAAQLAARAGAESVSNEVVLRESSIEAASGTQRLARKVEFELYATDAFDLDPIDISASDGEVRLSGSVRSLAERLLAERIAADAAGVESVVNGLEVTGSGS